MRVSEIVSTLLLYYCAWRRSSALPLIWYLSVRRSRYCQMCSGIVLLLVHWMRLYIVGGKCSLRGIRVMSVIMIVYWHWRIVGCVLVVGGVVVILGIITGWRFGCFCGRRIVEIIIDRKVGQRGLRKWLSDQFTLLVLQMGEVAHGLLLGQSRCFGKSLLIPAFDNLANSLQRWFRSVKTAIREALCLLCLLCGTRILSGCLECSKEGGCSKLPQS
jgi:hypothetical protein